MLARLSLRVQLGIALVAVALLGIGIATLLSNEQLPGVVNSAANERIDRQSRHLASAAAALYAQNGRWTHQSANAIIHEGRLVELETELLNARGRPIAGRSPGQERVHVTIRVAGKRVGELVVAPSGRRLLTPEEAHLHRSLDRLHLVAAGTSALAALLIALLVAETLTRPLRRIRQAAERMESGELETRVDVHGSSELAAVGHALNRLAGTLEQQEQVSRETVANLAHELRTPVSGLLSRIEAAQDEVLEDTQANLEAMHGEVLRLSVLLDDLARLAEAQRPGLLIEKRPVDLTEVAAERAGAFAARFAEKGIELETDLVPTLVLADVGRLTQILSNLLENALRYTAGGGRVLVAVREQTVAEADEAVLEVTDTGIGIAPEDLGHVLTRFWRGEKSRSRETGGAGIGLAIVAELVHAHEGRIEIESEPGRGSTFRVVLPRYSGP